METQELNLTRKLYRKILRLPSDEEINDAISAKNEFESLLKHHGWVRLEKFIASQEEGITETMRRGIRPDLIFGKSRMQKYDEMQTELKTYAKIKKFIEIKIENGKRHELRAAKTAELTKNRAKKE